MPSALTQLTWSLTPPLTQLRNNEIFVNLDAFCTDSVDVDTHSAFDSVDVKPHSSLTQLMVNLTPP
jgi:hypothetical protein